MELNVIGDIGGRMKTLEALLKQMPPSATPFSVGDMIDRGPSSRDVVQFFKDEGRAIKGNHEDMMACVIYGRDRYHPSLWLENGGWATLDSYNPDKETFASMMKDKPVEISNELFNERIINIDSEHVDWCDNLDMFYLDEDQGILITHAPISKNGFETLGQPKTISDFPHFLWHRGVPHETKWLNIFGHVHNWENSQRLTYEKDGTVNWFEYTEPSEFSVDDRRYGICIDTDYEGYLTGIHIPSMKYYKQEFLD